GTFEPPITVNPGVPSRDIAWVPNSDQGPLLASVDAQVNAVSLYAYRNGSFVQIGSLPTGQLPAQIIAADPTAHGRGVVVVRNAGDGTLTLYFNNGPGLNGSSLAPETIPADIGVSDVQAVDTTGNGWLDLVLTNKLTGQVTVLHNLGGGGAFADPVTYR